MTVCGWSLSSHGRSGALRSSRAGWTEELRFYPGGVNAHVHSVVCACPTPFWTICRNELGVSGNITHATVLLKLLGSPVTSSGRSHSVKLKLTLYGYLQPTATTATLPSTKSLAPWDLGQ